MRHMIAQLSAICLLLVYCPSVFCFSVSSTCTFQRAPFHKCASSAHKRVCCRVLKLQSVAGTGLEERDELLKWFDDQRIVGFHIEPADFNGLRGIMAKEEIHVGDALVKLPLSATLCVGDRQPCPIPEWVDSRFWYICSLHVRLALLLLFELGKGKSSEMYPWLTSLPTSHQDKLARWEDWELSELHDKSLQNEAIQQRAIIDDLYSTLQRSSPQTNVTLDTFRWAMDTIISRSFIGQMPNESLGRKYSIWQQVLVGAAAKLRRKSPTVCRKICSVVPGMRRYVDGTLSSQQLLLMEPFIDFFNHRTTASTETTYDPSSDTLTTRTFEPWNRGQQVFLCYGCKPNRHLLLSYGFVEEGNPVDRSPIPGLLSAAMADLRTAGVGAAEIDRRIELLRAGGKLQALEKATVGWGGLSRRTAEALAALLSPDGGIGAGGGIGGGAGVDIRRRLLSLAAAECDREAAAAATSLEEDLSLLSGAAGPLCVEHPAESAAAAAAEGGGEGGAGVAAARRRAALAYRIERKRVLRAAAATMRDRAATATAGEEAAADGSADVAPGLGGADAARGGGGAAWGAWLRTNFHVKASEPAAVGAVAGSGGGGGGGGGLQP